MGHFSLSEITWTEKMDWGGQLTLTYSTYDNVTKTAISGLVTTFDGPLAGPIHHVIGCDRRKYGFECDEGVNDRTVTLFAIYAWLVMLLPELISRRAKHCTSP